MVTFGERRPWKIVWAAEPQQTHVVRQSAPTVCLRRYFTTNRHHTVDFHRDVLVGRVVGSSCVRSGSPPKRQALPAGVSRLLVV